MGMKFDKDPLAVEQNNYLSEVANIYLLADLHSWPKISLRTFTIKNCLFGTTSIVKNSDKEKYVYSDYRIAFDGKDWCSFENDYARKFIIFGVDNISSSHANNLII